MEPWICNRFKEKLPLYRPQVLLMQVDKGWTPIAVHPKSTPTLDLNSLEMISTTRNGRENLEPLSRNISTRNLCIMLHTATFLLRKKGVRNDLI